MIFGMGVPELLLILAVVLIIFGPKNLPKIGASMGKTVKNFREGMEEENKPADDAQVEDVEPEDSDADASKTDKSE